jgi:exosortase C (VPDSG-CTERM-specific)
VAVFVFGVPFMHHYRRFLIFGALLTLCFALPLAAWVRFALNSALFSYALLIPLISGYLIWIRRKDLTGEIEQARLPAAILAVIGLGLLLAATLGPPEDILTCEMISYCCFVWSGGFAFLGMRIMRMLAFPALFLVFIAPIPPGVVERMEEALQNASADVAYRFIKLSSIAVYRSGLDFQMPGIALSVARECSGIHSTLVLFLCSLLAGHLFLRSAWMRWIIALFVIPLGIARNAFRILVLALLCVRVDSTYIHSPIHHSGGPIFFVLSLIPFGILLIILRYFQSGKPGASGNGNRA